MGPSYYYAVCFQWANVGAVQRRADAIIDVVKLSCTVDPGRKWPLCLHLLFRIEAIRAFVVVYSHQVVAAVLVVQTLHSSLLSYPAVRGRGSPGTDLSAVWYDLATHAHVPNKVVGVPGHTSCEWALCC